MENKTSKKGFTLIELLIVIALLGALAVGLLAALDPFEQFKKGTDTGIRNTVSELHQAVIRYYAIKGRMPWCADSDCTTLRDSLASEPAGIKAENLSETIDEIVTTGELKKDFKTLAATQLPKIYVTGTNDPPEITVCFKPISKSFQKDPNTKYVDPQGQTEDNPTSPQCKTNGGSNDCYWCVK